MSADYKDMYLTLVHAVNDAVNILEHGGSAHSGQAKQLLREGLLSAEEIFIRTRETKEDT